MKRIISFFMLILASVFCLAGCQESISINNDFLNDVNANEVISTENELTAADIIEFDSGGENVAIEEDGIYTDKDGVALYIRTYNKLPSNYITKKEAQEIGWNNKENTVAEILPEMSIGGDYFGNYEGRLPQKQGRTYWECDIDYETGARNAKRLVYSNDGLIFYTEDHYNSFEQLY